MQENKKEKAKGRPIPPAIVLGVAESYALGVAIGGLLRGPFKDPTHEIDHRLTDVAREASNKKLDRFMALMSGMGEPSTLYPVTGLAALLWLVRGRKTDSVGIVTALLGSALMNRAVKESVQRPRPKLVIHRKHSRGSSYPSNHITMGFAVFGSIAYLIARRRRKQSKGRRARLMVWAPALLLCSLIGWSRVYQGVHQASDVAAGWLLGAIWVGTCAQVVDRLEGG